MNQDMNNIAAHFRAMGYSVSVRGKNATVSLSSDDVSTQDVSELLTHAQWIYIDRLVFNRHRDDNSFDTVKIIFK